MNRRELPIKFEEVSEEEKAQMKRPVGRNYGLVRGTPGNILLPARYADLASSIYNFEFRSDDIVVVTYPKTGTVWTAELLWALTHLDQLHTLDTDHISLRNFFIDRDFIFPPSKDDPSPLVKAFLEKFPNGRVEDGVVLQLAKAETGRRIIKTHLPLHFFNEDLLKKTKVVYVARNPKDTCVSYHFFLRQRQDQTVECDFPTMAEQFMTDKCNYSPFWGHIQPAWDLRDHPNLHFVFYEDMKADIVKELQKINDFLSLDLTVDQLTKVAEATSFDNMRRRDQNQPLVKGTFFRKGIIGDWKNMATPELDAKMDRWIAENSKKLGITFRYA
ncbi:sulfotransferase 1A3-like [Macrobrachium rosenbergii]|uniref:sulfotransferase 1A3-like n=1 Tax=Macrobrachium rosenbergii TaxID=79674 RepID=UPI0034D58A4D